MNASAAPRPPRSTRSEEDRREALAWLGRRLAWEDVLGRLSGAPSKAPAAPLRRSA